MQAAWETRMAMDHTPSLGYSTATDEILRNRRLMRCAPVRCTGWLLRRVMRLDEEELRVGHHSSSSSKLSIVLDLLRNLSFVVVGVTMLALSKAEKPPVPLRFWASGYVVLSAVHIGCVIVSKRGELGFGSEDWGSGSEGDNDESELTRIEEHRRCCKDCEYGQFHGFSGLVACWILLGGCWWSFKGCSSSILDGATEQEINSLPKFKFRRIGDFEIVNGQFQESSGGSKTECDASTPNEHVISQDHDCCICLEVYQNGEELRQLPCHHCFHCACIDKWLRKITICPMCKFDFLKPIYGDGRTIV